MTVIISLLGIAGRMAGDVLASSLGWASSLLFGRVPRSHQSIVALMLWGSLLWILLVAAVLLPGLGSFLRTSTPVVSSVATETIRVGAVLTIAILPLGIGVAGYLVPSRGERARGRAAVAQVLRGYPLALALGGMLLFLPAIGIDRKVRSIRRGWSDIHIPIVVKPGGYDQLVHDLRAALEQVGLTVSAKEAPGVLAAPGRLLALIADGNVRNLVPDRLMELNGDDLEIGVYPSDVAISGGAHERTRARAAVISGLATTAAHFTMSAESQAVEDDLAAAARAGDLTDGALEKVDRALLEVDVESDDWETLYRLRLQAERDALRG